MHCHSMCKLFFGTIFALILLQMLVILQLEKKNLNPDQFNYFK